MRWRWPRRRRAERAEEPDPAVEAAARERSIRWRMLFVMVLLGAAMLVAGGRALVLQTNYREDLEREAARNYVRTVPLDDWRGDIADRNGALLATSVHRWAITADPQFIQDPATTAAVLGRLIDRSPGELAAKLGPRKTTREADAMANPVARTARRLVDPAVRALDATFGQRPASLEVRLRLVGHFYQMEQLQTAGIHGIIDVLARASAATSQVLASGSTQLRLLERRGRRFTYLARDVSDEAATAIAHAKERERAICREARDRDERCSRPLRGVRVRAEPKRYYPKREIATQLVGLVNPDGKGLSGVERSLGGLLAGGEHLTRAVTDHRGRSMYLEGIPEDTPFTAPTVELAIDEQIQAFAEHAISEACMVAGARAGFAVVMSVKTGEVLASASFPTYNPNAYKGWFRDRQPLLDEGHADRQARDDLMWAAQSPLIKRAFPGQFQDVITARKASWRRKYDAYVEYAHAYPNATRAVAFQDVYEPGSIAKVFTIAAGIEEGVVTLNKIYDLEDGVLELHDPDNTRIRDSSRHDDGTVAVIMKKSSNIGAAKIGFDLGAERLYRYFRAFGFGSRTGSGFPGEAAGLLLPSSEWTIVHLANISFGQGFAATGIQLAAALSAIGNGGKLMRPIFVRRVRDATGHVVRSFEPEVVRQVISPRTARTVLDLMRGVVEPDGTGSRAYIPEYPVAGKTGTAQKSHLRKRGYADDMWVATFFGVAPADDPELAVVVLVDEPKGEHHSGGIFAAPAFRRIMGWSLRHLGVPSPYEASKRVAWIDPATLAKRRTSGGMMTTDGHKEALRPPVDPARVGDVPVPDFRGMTMDQVRAAARAAGLDARLRGSGRASNQDVAPHTRVPAWSPVTVTFAPRSAPPTPPKLAAGPSLTTPEAASAAASTPTGQGGRP